MDLYIEQLNAYIEENKRNIDCPNAETILGMLDCCYHQQRCLDTAAVQAYFAQLDDILNALPNKKASEVVDLACKLCGEHQKDAFREGILVGFRLYGELHSKSRGGS